MKKSIEYNSVGKNTMCDALFFLNKLPKKSKNKIISLSTSEIRFSFFQCFFILFFLFVVPIYLINKRDIVSFFGCYMMSLISIVAGLGILVFVLEINRKKAIVLWMLRRSSKGRFVTCYSCGYDTKKINSNHCPECGSMLVWEEEKGGRKGVDN